MSAIFFILYQVHIVIRIDVLYLLIKKKHFSKSVSNKIVFGRPLHREKHKLDYMEIDFTLRKYRQSQLGYTI